MKILYLITSSDNSAKGGHFRSMVEVAKLVSLRGHKIHILNLGMCLSPVIKSQISKDNITFIKCNLFLVPVLLFKVIKLILKFRPDVLHAYDFASSFLAQLIHIIFNIHYVQNKCGGINYKKMLYAQDIIVFSKENYNYYHSLKNFNKIRIHFVPNRAHKKEQDECLINLIKSRINNNYPIILKINRFSKYYDKSINQTLDLKIELNKKNIKSNLLIVGTIVESDFFNELYYKVQSLQDGSIHLITEDRITIDAAKIIKIANIVIGTGRGFMEAALLGKLMMVPGTNYKFPLLVNKKIFDNAFYYNFSERVIIDELELDQNFDSLLEHLSNSDMLVNYKKEMEETFISFFDIDIGINKYLQVYDSKYESKTRVIKGISWALYYFLMKMISISIKEFNGRN